MISRPAKTAEKTLPPAASTLTDANCAAPANTRTDIATAAHAPMTGSARIPNDAPSANVGMMKTSPALMPASFAASYCQSVFDGTRLPEPGGRTPAPGSLRLVQLS